MKITTHILAATVALGLALPAAAEVKIALDSPPDLEHSGSYVWAHAFANHLNANGKEATEFERDALGDEAERLDQVSQGLLEVSLSDVKSAGTLDGTVFGLYLPYFFEDAEQLDATLNDGGMLVAINEGTAPKGVRVAAVVHLGAAFGIFTTNTPVRSVEDMTNVRMRALDESQIALYEGWGSQGTIVNWGEVPNALQTGVADGYINTPFAPLLFGHAGFIRHFTDARITPAVRLALFSEDWYQGLSDHERAIVDDGVGVATQANREWLAGRTTVLDSLREAGIEVIALGEAEREAFRRKSEASWTDFPLPEGALDRWKAASGN